jgi:hypothetical protein
VARHCADNNDAHVVNVKGLDTDAALRLFNEKVCACYPARSNQYIYIYIHIYIYILYFMCAVPPHEFN